MKRLIAILVLLVLVPGCAGLPPREAPPRVNLVNLRPLEMTLFEQRYGLTLRIQNPDRHPIHIQGLSFEVELNGRPFAHGVSDRQVEVPAFGEALLEVEVVSTLFSLVEQIRQLDERAGMPLSYRISGRINSSGSLVSIPFEQKGELGGPAAPVKPD